MNKEAKKIEIDANGKKLGRLASQVAVLLMGKDSASWKRNEAVDRQILVKNASKIAITEVKRNNTVYTRYSGYPGGLKFSRLSEIITKKGMKEVLRNAVLHMMPSNRLRAIRIKKLTIEE